MPTFRVIGPGRAGESLRRALERAGWTDRGSLRRGDALAAAADGVDVLVVATPDAAVADVAGVVEPVASTLVVHLSGSLGLDALAPHPRRASVHPLVALAEPDTGADALVGAWFAVAGDDDAARVVTALGGRAFQVADDRRALYHAAACVASNHTVGVLGQVERLARAAGVPVDPFLDLARATVDNVARLGATAALTGPAARGDTATLDRHRAAVGDAERAGYEAGLRLLAPLVGRRDGAGPVVVDTVAAFSKTLDAERAAGRTVGLVPTMGYLHEGHAALLRRARRECDVVALTVFVNPLQFAPSEDLSAYPRDLDADLALARACGVDVVFTPPVEEMYPSGAGGVATTVSVRGVSDGMEGASRPTHFDGVATVVAKLFAMAGSCRAYFGEKDFQQAVILETMAADLSFPVEVVGCPTVREADGLAHSSRNVYLTAAERAAAPVLHRALVAGRDAVIAGERDADRVRALMADVLGGEPLVSPDYVEVADPADLSPLTTITHEARLLVAARLGRARLIDNLGVTAP